MRKLRKAFSMLVAIFIIVFLSLIATYIYYSSSLITKEGIIMYQEEQAKILARSYTEYAILAISGNNRNSGQCINEINAKIGNDPYHGQGYLVKVYITYIGNQKYINNCRNKAATLPNNDIDSLSVIIDVYVDYKDYTHRSNIGSFSRYIPWTVYHRRSIQKI